MNPTENLELYHWGVKGMKWGVRRYQKKDGTLTNAGKKHYSAEMEKLRAESKVIANKKRTAAKMAKLDDLRKKNESELAELEPKSKKSKKQSPSEPAKKSISQMTDAELQSYKQRLQLEKDTYDLQNKISQLNPPKESAAKKMIENYGPAIAKAVWNDVAKPSLNKYLEQKYKIEKPLDELGKLKKEADIWTQKANIAKNKKVYADNMEKLQEGDERRAKREQEKENLKRAQQQVDDYNNSGRQSDSVTSGGRPVNSRTSTEYVRTPLLEGNSNTSKKTESKAETWTGTVEGEGTSRFTGWKNTGAKYYDNARYTEVNVGTAVATRSASTGKKQSNSILNRIGNTSVYMLEDRNGR